MTDVHNAKGAVAPSAGDERSSWWEYPLYIDGEWVQPDAAGSIEVIDPATEALIGRVPATTPALAERALRAARRAFDEGPWPRMPVKDRAVVMKRFAEILDSRRDALKELLIAESGSTAALADLTQVGKALEAAHYCADNATSITWEEMVLPDVGPRGITDTLVVREPAGVVSAITPFNFPLFLAIWKVAPALVTGNTVVLKPHPWTPLSSFEVARAAEEAGVPPGVLNVVTGGGDIGEILAGSDLSDLVTFTGSTATGRRILELAAPTVKKVHLELGGKSATVVLDDASPDQVAQLAMSGCLGHAGQGCSAQTRMILPEHMLDTYLDGAIPAVSNINIGDPRDPTTELGPLIRERQRERVESYVQSGLNEGAELVVGGRRPPHMAAGFFYEPTILVNCRNDMTVCRDEIFGPVLSVLTYRDESDAIRIANDSIYGLGGGVVSSNRTRALGVARQLRTGIVRLVGGQGGTGMNFHAPWGGYKQSGLGREWSKHGLEEFTELKQISWACG